MVDWTAELVDQLQWHWDHHLRPKLEGLTDDEYFWEPAPGTWNIRPRGTSDAPIQAGSGDLVIEFAIPEPDPPPLTTIAWRLGHVLVGVLGARNAAHFSGPAVDYATATWPATAAEALARLDEAYAYWRDHVSRLTADELAQPAGPAEGPYADRTLAALVLHINRELIHHGAEILLLRDLHRTMRAIGP